MSNKLPKRLIVSWRDSGVRLEDSEGSRLGNKHGFSDLLARVLADLSVGASSDESSLSAQLR